MLNQAELLIILLDYLSYLLRPLVASLQLKLDAVRLATTGIWNKRRWSERTRNRPLHVELAAYCQLLAERRNHRLALCDHYEALATPQPDELWIGLAGLRRLQMAVLLGPDRLAAQAVPLEEPLVRLLDWPACDLLLISALDEQPPAWSARLVDLVRQVKRADERREASAPQGGAATCKRPEDMRLLCALPDTRTALVSLAGGRAFCLLRHLTLGEFRLHEARSRLIFRLVQREGEPLLRLFSLVGSLLERAGLLEPAGFYARARAGEQVASGENDDSWLEAARRLNNPISARRLLARYALFVMLAAYVQANGRGASLAALLTGFLRTFGRAAEIDTPQLLVVGPAASERGHVVCQLELSFRAPADSISRRAGKCRHLIVLEPADGEPVGGANGRQSQEQANLTGQLESWPTISALFRRTHSLLAAHREGEDSLKTLSAMLELADRQGQAAGTFQRLDDCTREEFDSESSEQLESDEPRCQLRRGSNSPLRLCPTGTTNNRLWKSLLYFTLFLVARNLLINYLEGVQKDLKQTARDDFIELKRWIFADSYLAAAEGAHEHESRDEDELLSEDQKPHNDLEEEEKDDEDDEGHEGDEGDEEERNLDGGAHMEQLMGALFGGLLSKGLDGGGGGLNLENMQRILTALTNGEGGVDTAEMSEVLAAFQQLLPALMGGDGGGGSPNFADLLANLKDDDQIDDRRDNQPTIEPTLSTSKPAHQDEARRPAHEEL